MEPANETRSTPDKRKNTVIAVVLLIAVLAGLVWFYSGTWLNKVKPGVNATAPAEVRAKAAGPVVPEPEVAVGGPVVKPREGEAGYAGKLTPIVIDGLPLDFIRDIVRYCVDQYQPAGTRLNPGKAGVSALTFKRLNQKYGNDLSRLGVAARRIEEGRHKFYGFIFSKGTVKRLQDAVGGEIARMAEDYAAQSSRDFETSPGVYVSRKLDKGQVREMLTLSAVRLRHFERCFKGVAGVPAFEAKAVEYNEAEEAQRLARIAYEKAKGDLALFTDKTGDGIELSQSYKQAMRDLTLKRDEAMTRVRTETTARESARRRLVASVRGASGRLDMDDDEVVYISQWIFRRSEIGGEYKGVIEQLAQAAGSVSEKLRGAGAGKGTAD